MFVQKLNYELEDFKKYQFKWLCCRPALDEKKNFLATSHKCEHFWTNKHAIFELPVKTSK